MDYFCFHHSTERTYSRRFVDLFGAPRDPRAPFFTPRAATRPTSGLVPADHAAQAERTSTTPTSRPASSTVTEEIVLRMARHAAPRDGPAAPLHGRRRGAQQRGQRADPARDAVRGAVHPAGGGRRRRRAGRGALRLPRGPGPAAQVRDGARLLGPGVRPRPEVDGAPSAQRGRLHAVRRRRRAARPRRRRGSSRARSSGGSRAASSGGPRALGTAASWPTRAARR